MAEQTFYLSQGPCSGRTSVIMDLCFPLSPAMCIISYFSFKTCSNDAVICEPLFSTIHLSFNYFYEDSVLQIIFSDNMAQKFHLSCPVRKQKKPISSNPVQYFFIVHGSIHEIWSTH